MPELTPSIAARMAKLRQESNQSPRSNSINPSPLSLYLAIYNKANRECYIDYMQGAKDLYNWLTSNGAVPLEIEEPSEFEIPKLSSNYSLVEIVKILVPKNNLKERARIHKAILVIIYKDLF